VLDLRDHLDRKPANLSGGQRQRVAMGRAIVRDPVAFLMDEPLSNLDAKLRVQMRTEVSRIQDRTGTTTVYVTHDQTEAMTLGDRVAVMRGGTIQQVGTPRELYSRPRNLFVGGFIGSPAMNFMPAELEDGRLRLPMGEVALPEELQARIGRTGEGKRTVIAGIRPEDFEDASLAGSRHGEEGVGTTFRTRIDVLESMGSELYVYFAAGSGGIDSAELRELAEDSGSAEVPGAGTDRVVARLDIASEVRQGTEAELWLDASKVVLFDPESGRNLGLEQEAGAAA